MAKQGARRPETPGRRGRVSRKAKIVAATETLLRERGLAGVTTRAIAETVPCSEGAIYVHFHDRLELLLALLADASPEMREPLHKLDHQVGESTPVKNLAAAAAGLQRFHDRVIPMLCALMMDQELRQRFTKSLQQQGKGPQRGIATLARYIEREQDLGRVAADVDARAAAAAIMAGSFFEAFTAQLFGSTRRMNPKPTVKHAIALMLRDTMK